MLDSLAGIALVYAGKGKAEEALKLLASVQHHPALTQETKIRVDQLAGEITIQFSAAQREGIYAQAQARPIQAFVEEILAAHG